MYRLQITSQGCGSVGRGCLAPGAMGAGPSNSAKMTGFSRAIFRLAAEAQGHALSPLRSVQCIVLPQHKVQVHKRPVMFGLTVANNIPGPNASD